MLKKIIFCGIFYIFSVIGIYLQYNINIFSSMIYGLTWFFVFFLIKYFLPSKHKFSEYTDNTSISRPYDKFLEGK